MLQLKQVTYRCPSIVQRAIPSTPPNYIPTIPSLRNQCDQQNNLSYQVSLPPHRDQNPFLDAQTMQPDAMIDPTDPECLLGVTLDSHLTLTTVLGMGSFAIVYEGRSTRYEHPVAVKALFKQDLSPDLLAVQRREGDFMAKLSHPNIVALLETIETQECLFLVMELVDTDLFDLIERSEVRFEDVTDIFDQICSAVMYSHSMGVYVRDLKPENVLMSRDSNVAKLTDFGLATTDAISTEMGIGSVRYMSPECFDGGESYDSASNDAWALGIILINLLTGTNPWVEPHAADRYYAEFSRLGTDSLKQRFGFSDEFLDVLHSIFVRRAGVSELREQVRKVTYFFAPPTDDAYDEEQAYFDTPSVVPHPAPAAFSSSAPAASSFDWAADDGEMDYDVLPVFETKRESSSIVAHKLEPFSSSTSSATLVEEDDDNTESALVPSRPADSRRGTGCIPVPPPPTPVIAPRRFALGINTTPEVTTPTEKQQANPPLSATELIRNTINTLQCFLTGMGDKVPFDRAGGNVVVLRGG